MSPTQIQSGFIEDNVVTTAQIASGAVTTAKLDSTVSGALVPIGGIIMWSGSVATIPSSWRLCNGANGTPNLQDRFVVGAGSGYIPGNNGGSANATLVSHSHTGTTDTTSLTGSFNPGCNNSLISADGVFSNVYNGSREDSSFGNGGMITMNATHDHTFTTSDAKNGVGTIIGASATDKNLPPYYALAFIMRVS